MYDHLNSYTDEAGSDGVVRVAAANMNYGLIRLVQKSDKFALVKDDRREKYAMGVLPGRSHSGNKIGILASVPADSDGSHPTLQWVLRCLEVGSVAAYNRLAKQLEELTAKTQLDEHEDKEKAFFVFQRTFITNRYCMLVFKISDDRGNHLADYDVLFTAGPDYDPNHLPPGFFVDRQRNQRDPGKLTYYIDYDVMSDWLSRPQLEGKFGFRIAARPAEGFAYYAVAEHKGTFVALKRYFAPNQTLMIDVQLQRRVKEGVFDLTTNLGPEDFRNQEAGDDIL